MSQGSAPAVKPTAVHDATYEVLRSLGMTTIFGNPGSNELPFIDHMPSDFRYILTLHEGAGLAIADGYSQATGRPVMVFRQTEKHIGDLFWFEADCMEKHI